MILKYLSSWQRGIMKLTIDTENKTVVQQTADQKHEYNLYSKDAFEILSNIWLKVGWSQRYDYTYTWLGRPIIQLPNDMIRLQEVIYCVKPDVIVETGIAHGGSLIFSASLCKAIGKGRVIGVDIEIRPHNRKAIEEHSLSPLVTLVEGSSIDPAVVQFVKSMIQSGETALVLLDSNHTKQHVLMELDAYHDIVTPGSFIVATDGVMKDLYDVPRGKPEWSYDNPSAAAFEFVKNHEEFVLEQPDWPFNESTLNHNITHWPNAWIRRK